MANATYTKIFKCFINLCPWLQGCCNIQDNSFVIIVNRWKPLKPLTIITKRSILDAAATLDPPLAFSDRDNDYPMKNIRRLIFKYLNIWAKTYKTYVSFARFGTIRTILKTWKTSMEEGYF